MRGFNQACEVKNLPHTIHYRKYSTCGRPLATEPKFKLCLNDILATWHTALFLDTNPFAVAFRRRGMLVGFQPACCSWDVVVSESSACRYGLDNC